MLSRLLLLTHAHPPLEIMSRPQAAAILGLIVLADPDVPRDRSRGSLPKTEAVSLHDAKLTPVCGETITYIASPERMGR